MKFKVQGIEQSALSRSHCGVTNACKSSCEVELITT